MAGTDLMDRLIRKFDIHVEAPNVMMRIFHHLVDMAATNAFILYHRIHAERCVDSSNGSAKKEELLKLPEFREAIAKRLVAYTEDVRFDGLGHWPNWLPNSGDERLCEHCKTSQSQCVCVKCTVHLCCDEEKNCFYDYHHRE